MPLQIFGKSSKNPSDVVRSLKEALITLESKENNTSTGETSGMLMAIKVPLKVGCTLYNREIMISKSVSISIISYSDRWRRHNSEWR